MISKKNRYSRLSHRRFTKTKALTPDSFDFDSIQKKLEFITKNLALVSILCYASGLLVVNIYLSSFHMNDFYLLESKYVIVGALFIIYTTANFLLYYFAYHLVRKKEIVYGIVCVIVGVFLAFIFNSWLFTLTNWNWESAWRRGIQWHLELVVFLVIYLFLVMIARLRTPKHRIMTLVHNLLTAILIVGFVLGYLYHYSNQAFPFLPVEYGGGEMTQVELILKSEAASSLQKAGLPFQGDSPITEPVLVIFEARNDYILALPEYGNVLKLDKDIVLGMKVLVKR